MRCHYRSGFGRVGDDVIGNQGHVGVDGSAGQDPRRGQRNRVRSQDKPLPGHCRSHARGDTFVTFLNEDIFFVRRKSRNVLGRYAMKNFNPSIIWYQWSGKANQECIEAITFISA